MTSGGKPTGQDGPTHHRFGRRALLVGTGIGAAGAAVAYQAVRNSDGPARPPQAAPSPPEATYEQRVDLTVRWRHLESSVAIDDLLAAWTFDEGGGYRFADVTGNRHSLVIIGSRWNTSDSGLLSAIHRQGLRGGAVHLDGTRWLATEPTLQLLSSTGFSIGCWLRPESSATQPEDLAQYGASWRLTRQVDDSVTVSLGTRTGSERRLATPPGAVHVGDWVQVGATVDPSSGVLRLYVDGQQVAESRGRPFDFGSQPDSLVVGNGFRGDLDELTLHRVPLRADQMRRWYVVGLPKVFTQTSESIDPEASTFTRYHGSDPIPHPVVATTVLTLRFAETPVSDQGLHPTDPTEPATFAPGAWGGAWRAQGHRLTYPSPLAGDTGTFEAWYRTLQDPHDPQRTLRKEFFVAEGSAGSLVLATQGGRWQVELRRAGTGLRVLAGPTQVLTPGTLEHVAVTWGQQAGGRHAVVLYVNGVPAGLLPSAPGDTSYTASIGLGGTRTAPTYALLDDVRICSSALPWGEICPRGQASTDSAGLDLRDRFNRPDGARPLLWRSTSAGGRWSHRWMTWERPAATGADPDSARALFQDTASGLHAVCHPDAFGLASSIEAGVATADPVDGWAGVYIQGSGPTEPFAGITFMVNPQRGLLRLARYVNGAVTTAKALPYGFAMAPRTTYELTLTNHGDGVVRGFVDGSNLISLSAAADWPASGYSGLVTDDARAFFSNLHFCALTPATPQSRVVRTRVHRYGVSAGVARLELTPFRWHKRRGLLPWRYTSRRPEPPGNIAGADTAEPLRPIPPAAWRSEDSANTDVIVVAGRVLVFMRGNPRIAERPGPARIGVLETDVASFDGVHLTDVAAQSADGAVTGPLILTGSDRAAALVPTQAGSRQLNEPSTAYIGGGRLLFFGRESEVPSSGDKRYGRLAYSRYDVVTGQWEHEVAQHVPWSHLGPLTADAVVTARPVLHGTPEIVALRRPDDDSFEAVIFQQVGVSGSAVMATAMLDGVAAGVPSPAPGNAVHTSLSRASGGAIYGFRVLFDNGIYYLHYNDGNQVPDWPDRFALAAAVDPYAGPWVANPRTREASSRYFRRGTAVEPDNGAIWQGTMLKHRGCYYLYYENYHSVANVDDAYADYADPQAGSRVGFATAGV